MSEQIKIENAPTPQRRHVLIGGFPQNFYIRALTVDTSTIPAHLKSHTQKKYQALEEIPLDDGLKHVIVEKDYPINKESVASYIDSSDYRNDPAQAIAGATKRVNLGDISQAQYFLNSDPIKATSKYSEILQKVADYFKSQEKAQAQPAPAPTAGNEVK